MMISRRPLAIALLAVLATGLAACGGGDDDDDGDAGGDTSEVDAAGDRAIIDDAIITVDDLPDGFEAQDDEDDDEDDDEEVEDDTPDECFEDIGIDPDDIDDARVVEGDDVDFQLVTEEALVGITASIDSFDGSDAPRENLVAFGDDDFIECAVQAIERSSADQGQEVGDVAAEAIDSPVDADEATSVRFEFETQGVPTIVEQHLVLVGRFGISLQVLTVNDEPDEGLAADLLEAMIERIEDATG